MFKEHGLCPMLSLTDFKIIPSKYIGMTLTLIVCLSSHIRDNRPQAYWCHRSPDYFILKVLFHIGALL